MKARSGQALLLVMWAMFIMTFAILGLVRLLNITIGTSTAMERVAIASASAFAGITIGRNEAFPANGQAQKQKFSDGSAFEVVAVSENSKLNINQLLAAGDRGTLRALFRLWRLNEVQADTAVDCLLDYVEPGGDRRLNGAKAEQYRAAKRPAPSGKPFTSLDEMERVLHFDLVTERKPDWRDYFTVYGDGVLDLVAAPPDLLKIVCGIGDSGVRSLVQKRSEANSTIKDLAGARLAMGLTEKEFEGISGRVSVGGKIRRVRSAGSFDAVSRTIEAICQMDAKGGPKFLEWKEW